MAGAWVLPLMIQLSALAFLMACMWAETSVSSRGPVRSFHRAQHVFRQAMRTPLIWFHVVPAAMKEQYELLSQNESRQACPSRFSPDSPPCGDSRVASGLGLPGPPRVPRIPQAQDHPDAHTRLPHMAPQQPAARPPGAPTPALHGVGTFSSTMGSTYSTKKIGKRLNIQLKKGVAILSPVNFLPGTCPVLFAVWE